MNNNIQKQATKLVEQANQIHDRFEASKDNARMEEKKLQEELQQLQEQEKDIYSMYVLGDIDSTAYEDMKRESNNKRNQLATVQKKLQDIDTVKQREFSKLWHDSEEFRKAFYKELQKEKVKRDKQLIELKKEYLEKVAEVSKEQANNYFLERQINDIEVDAGLKKYNYTDFEIPFISPIGIHEARDYNIGTTELFNVYKNHGVGSSFLNQYYLDNKNN